MRFSVQPRYLLAVLLASLSAMASAQVEHRFSGFATLGLVHNNNSELVFRREIIQNDGSHDGQVSWKNDSLLGLQWSGRWSHQLDTSVQVILKDRVDNKLSNSLEWAFLRYRPIEDLDLRIGRMGIDIFMLSEYRQVGYAFPWVRPPHDTYNLLSLPYFDGIDLSKHFALGDARFNIKAFYGQAEQIYPYRFRSNDGARLDFKPAGLSLTLEQNNWKWRYSYADVHIDGDLTVGLVGQLEQAAPLWPEATEVAEILATRDKNFRYHQVGVNYDNNSWWLQLELVAIRSQTLLVPKSQHGYLTLGRRLGAFSVFGTTGYARPERDPLALAAPPSYPSPIGEQLALLASFAEQSINGARIEQYSVGAGVRWDFAPKMALKAQLEQFHVDKQGTSLWLYVEPSERLNSDQDARVISLALDVLF